MFDPHSGEHPYCTYGGGACKHEWPDDINYFYWGTTSAKTIKQRRSKNKAARKSRRKNRSK